MCMPCRTSRSAIFDLATVFSAAATNLPGDRPLDPAMTHKSKHADDDPEQRRSRPSAAACRSLRAFGGLFERNLQAGDDLGGHALDASRPTGCPRPAA